MVFQVEGGPVRWRNIHIKQSQRRRIPESRYEEDIYAE